MMDNFILECRGRGKLMCSLTVFDTGVRIRLDDANKPEWWAELFLASEDIKDLMMEMERIKGEKNGESGG